MKINWEEITTEHGDYLYRAKIFGGWLVKITCDVVTQNEYILNQTGFEWRSSITFIPDANHEWRN